MAMTLRRYRDRQPSLERLAGGQESVLALTRAAIHKDGAGQGHQGPQDRVPAQRLFGDTHNIMLQQGAKQYRIHAALMVENKNGRAKPRVIPGIRDLKFHTRQARTPASDEPGGEVPCPVATPDQPA